MANFIFKRNGSGPDGNLSDHENYQKEISPGNFQHTGELPGGGDTVIFNEGADSGSLDVGGGSVISASAGGSATINADTIEGASATENGIISADTINDSASAFDGGLITVTTLDGNASASGGNNARVHATTINGGTVTANGSGSEVTAQTMVHSIVGVGGSTETFVTVTNGGKVQTGSLDVATGSAKGMANHVSGTGSQLIVQDYGKLGPIGLTHTLLINDGGEAQITGAFVLGDSAGDDSSITVRDSGSEFTYVGTLEVGKLGRGTFRVEDGADQTLDGLLIGSQNVVGSTGLVNVVGAGTSLEITNDVIVSDGGAGVFAVGDDATATVHGTLTTKNTTTGGSGSGISISGGGALTVEGLTTIANVGRDLFSTVRYDEGSQSGGTLNATGGLTVAAQAGSRGDFWINGKDALLDTGASTVTIGDSGDGLILVTGGNSVHSGQGFGQFKAIGGTIIIGKEVTGVGDLFLSFIGAEGDIATYAATPSLETKDVIVGQEGNGGFSIGGHHEANLSGDLTISLLDGSEGSVGVGAAGRLNVAGDVLVALDENTSGTITVDGAGARLRAGNIFLGQDAATLDDCHDWEVEDGDEGGNASLTVGTGALASIAQRLELANDRDIFGSDPEAAFVFVEGGGLEIGGTSGAAAGTMLVHAGGTVVGHGYLRVQTATGAPGTIINGGTIEAKEGTLYVVGEFATGSTGTVKINDYATFDLLGGFTGTVNFDGDMAGETVSTLVLRGSQVATMGHPTTPFLAGGGTFDNMSVGDTIIFEWDALVNSLNGIISHTRINGSTLEILSSARGGGGDPKLTYHLEDMPVNAVFAVRSVGHGLPEPYGYVKHHPLPEGDHPDYVAISVGIASAKIQATTQTGAANPYIESLIWGGNNWVPGTTINWTMGDPGDATIENLEPHGETYLVQCGGDDLEAWSGIAGAHDAFMHALQIYEGVCNLNFNESAFADANLVFWANNNVNQADPGNDATSDTPGWPVMGCLQSRWSE